MAKITDSLIVYKKEELVKMLGELPFTDKQLNMLMAPTPKKFIHDRPIPGGGKVGYVSGHYMMNILNYITAYHWSFEILDEKEVYDQIIVEGKLTFVGKNGEEITKTQYGRAIIKKYSDNIKLKNGEYVKRTDGKAGLPVDYGNDFKAAATDALKKCASMIGVAWDVYGNEDFKQMKVATEPVVETDNNIAHDAPTVSIDDVKLIVDTKLAAMSPADKVRFLKDWANTVSDKKLTNDQYRRLYNNLPRKEERYEKS